MIHGIGYRTPYASIVQDIGPYARVLAALFRMQYLTSMQLLDYVYVMIVTV